MGKPTYPAWAQSIFLQPPRCLGVQLRPYSWAHYECLKRFYNPYLLTDAETSRKDLLMAVWICSRTWEQLQSQLFGARDSRSMLFLNWRTRRKGFEIGDAQMRVYMADYQFIPDAWEGKGNSDKTAMGAAQSFIFTAFLMEHCHFTESQAWNCPIGRSKCYRLTWLENQGKVFIKSAQSEIEHEIELSMGLTRDWPDEEVEAAHG